MQGKKIIIYGTGNLYKKYYNRFENCNIIAVVDSDDNKIDKCINGYVVRRPKIIQTIEYDLIVILIIDYFNVKQDLINQGVHADKIKTIDDYDFFRKYRQIDTLYFSRYKKEILLISHDMNYRGAPLMLYNMANVLRECGYSVDVACDSKEALYDLFVDAGFSVIYFTDFNLGQEDIVKYMKNYKLIIVNTLALWYLIPKLKILNKKIMWWLHEEESAYSILNVKLDGLKLYSNLKIYGVGTKAIEAFKKHTDNRVGIRYLQWGIENNSSGKIVDYKNEKLVFAVIGPVSYIKGQDFLIDTLNKYFTNVISEIEVIIIGSISDYDKKKYEQLSYVKCVGELTHNQLMKMFDQIGIVLNVSRNDTFPVALIEGMMAKKVCVMSDAVGTKEYIENYKNGIIFKSEDVQDLAKKIKWCMDNRNTLRSIALEGYNTYLQYFSKIVFKNNVNGIITKLIKS